MNNSREELIRQRVLKAGVKNLREFGYPNVDTENILTDLVYKDFFLSMLEDNLGKGDATTNAVLSGLIEEVKRKPKKGKKRK